MSVGFAANTMASIEFWYEKCCQHMIAIDSTDGLARNQKSVIQYTALIYSDKLRNTLQSVSRCAPRQNEQIYFPISPNSTLKKASPAQVRRTYGFSYPYIRTYAYMKPAIYALLPTLVITIVKSSYTLYARSRAGLNPMTDILVYILTIYRGYRTMYRSLSTDTALTAPIHPSVSVSVSAYSSKNVGLCQT
jgi:hypothetical protein